MKIVVEVENGWGRLARLYKIYIEVLEPKVRRSQVASSSLRKAGTSPRSYARGRTTSLFSTWCDRWQRHANSCPYQAARQPSHIRMVSFSHSVDAVGRIECVDISSELVRFSVRLRPLVTGCVREFVPIACGEIIKDSRTARTYTNPLAI